MSREMGADVVVFVSDVDGVYNKVFSKIRSWSNYDERKRLQHFLTPTEYPFTLGKKAPLSPVMVEEEEE